MKTIFAAFALWSLVSSTATAGDSHIFQDIRCVGSNGLVISRAKGPHYPPKSLAVTTAWGFASRGAYARIFSTGITPWKGYNVMFEVTMTNPAPGLDIEYYFIGVNLDLNSSESQKTKGILKGNRLGKLADLECVVQLSPAL